MSNPYYNGVQLPEIPSSFSSAYANICIIRNAADSNWVLLGCSRKMWYDPSKDAPAINQNAGTMGYCNYASSTNSWGSLHTGNYYFTYSSIVWSNYDVPSGSESSATIAFKGSFPTISMIRLVNETDARCANGVFSLTLSMPGCVVGNMLLLAYAVRGQSNIVTLSEGWCVLGGGNNASDASATYQRVFFAYKFADKSDESVTISQTVGNTIYAVCSEYAGAKYAVMRDDISKMGTVNYTVTASKEGSEDVVVYATSSAYYGTGRLQTVTPSDIEKIEGDSGAERLACWFDGGLGAIEHTFQTCNYTEARDAILECVQLLPRITGYASQGTAQYMLPKAAKITSYSSSMIQWTSEIPDGTECHVYFRRNQGEWSECYSGESLPGLMLGEDLSEDSMEVKVVLSSTDTDLTPKFSNIRLWVRNMTDKNVVVLSFNPGNVNSIQNAVGNVSVAYDGTGTLMGEGGPVLAFEHAFMPEGLESKNNLHDAEHVELVDVVTVATLSRIHHKSVAEKEHLNLSDIATTYALTHINDI